MNELIKNLLEAAAAVRATVHSRSDPPLTGIGYAIEQLGRAEHALRVALKSMEPEEEFPWL